MTAATPRRLVVRLDRPPISMRFGAGSVGVLVGALLGSLGLFFFGATIGDFPLPAADVVATLFGGGDETGRFVVWTLRLPRLLDAILVGAALAVSGAIFQALTRNPLVAPDIIGVNGGAALLAVAVIIFGLPGALVAPAAFVGGLGAAILLYVLAWRGGLSSYRLVLIGIGVEAVTVAGIGFLLTRGEIWDVQRALAWLIGSLSGASWEKAALIGGALLVLLPLVFILGRRLEVMQLGDDAAAGLGLRVERTRLLLIVAAVGLATMAVSVAGPIGFVAFVAPHLARRLARASGAGVLPASAAVGALLLIGADLVARRIVAPMELPVGIFTALLGAPYFLWLLVRSRQLAGGV